MILLKSMTNKSLKFLKNIKLLNANIMRKIDSWFTIYDDFESILESEDNRK